MGLLEYGKIDHYSWWIISKEWEDGVIESKKKWRKMNNKEESGMMFIEEDDERVRKMHGKKKMIFIRKIGMTSLWSVQHIKCLFGEQNRKETFLWKKDRKQKCLFIYAYSIELNENFEEMFWNNIGKLYWTVKQSITVKAIEQTQLFRAKPNPIMEQTTLKSLA